MNHTTTAASSSFENLMALGPIGAVASKDALQRIGLLVDLSHNLARDEGTARALEWCDELATRSLLDRQTALLEYFRANAWANRQRVRHRDAEAAWQWEQPELQRQILHLRRAAQSSGFGKLSRQRRCQVLTNLGNQLSTLGRCSEAIATWTRAVSIDPDFAMALGNRGCGLVQYARSLYDPGHRGVFLHFAHKDLSAALSSGAKYDGNGYQEAKAFFAGKKAEVESALTRRPTRRAIELDGYTIGTSKSERQYREWALRQRLFLNPLNDLGPYTVAARDLLSLPRFTTAIDEPPSLIGFFNQMKQEFVSGRWLLYEGVHADRVHFSDRHVTIYDTLDYPSYSLAIEKVKAAYRIGYSLLDKIAFFLNDYAKLGINSQNVSFRTIWYKNGDPKKRVIRKEFVRSKNWPLRGLYWLAKDLFDPELQDVMEPDAQALYIIRNHLEHGYLKIHEMLISRSEHNEFDKAWTDRLAYSVQRSDFEAKALQVFKMARAGLIYLSLGMHREEQRRAETKPDQLKMPMSLELWPDQWKRRL